MYDVLIVSKLLLGLCILKYSGSLVHNGVVPIVSCSFTSDEHVTISAAFKQTRSTCLGEIRLIVSLSV